jgi:putative oxidoreductase
MEATKQVNPTNTSVGMQLARPARALVALCQRVPDAAIALLGRLSIAAVFWQSGQTKVQGFAIDIVHGQFTWGWPHLSDSVVPLFAEEYRLPLLPPELAAMLAASAEHLFPVLLVLGLATRLSALALLGMTLTIQFLVYPDAYATHGTWAAVLLFLVARGPGPLALDHWVARRWK